MSTHTKFRIAFCRINQETHALSPVLTTLDDFERTHLLDADALLEATHPRRYEVQDLFRNVELSGFVKGVREAARDDVELVPLFSAWAAPGGPLSRACFEAFRARLLASLQEAGAIDGLYLSLHGAMNCEGSTDPEGELIRMCREQLGDDVKIAVSYDLHGNLTQQKVAHADIALAYKTNPHRDHAKIGAQAGKLLVQAVRGEVKPTTAWRSLPMILGGGITIDFLPPIRHIYARLRALEAKHPKVLAASVLMCHPWNADRELGWSVLVVTDDDAALAEQLAEELADMAWRVKDKLPPRFLDASEAILRAKRARIRRKLGTITLSDASDVVSAGATGENTKLAKALIEEGQGLVSYVPLRDPVAVAELWDRQIGEPVSVRVGGRLDPERVPPLLLDGVVSHKTSAHAVDRVVVVDVGTIRVILVEGPALAMKPSYYSNVGLNPWKADVLVVKNFFPFRLFFLPISRKTMYVTTGGLTDLDAALTLDFAGPVHPKDVVTDWRAADSRRRLTKMTAPPPLDAFVPTTGASPTERQQLSA